MLYHLSTFNRAINNRGETASGCHDDHGLGLQIAGSMGNGRSTPHDHISSRILFLFDVVPIQFGSKLGFYLWVVPANLSNYISELDSMEISDEAVLVDCSRLKSAVWKDFDLLKRGDVCIAVCKKKLSGSRTSGTTHI
ncbi:unnamed protein product [Lactuca virosa]|uniref:Uncharacterized protein n=1 Tax=Lactuca virosa TaxID=75947 RepID=A0AAU9N3C1_9ASTR|nr:unnamed protein product [Lactuca virosa]